jgi:BirA family biotin operon repressor/biotin-[acetyl-CoA-carboxylase] ligase
MNFTILRFDSVDSTNNEALKHARLGADEGLCVIARQQTAGRGRQGRTWVSPAGGGIYLSVVLKPQIDAKLLPLITLAASIAVHDTLVEIGLDLDIKWPNDVLVNEKKVCGILAETTETDRGLAVILGIGINVSTDSIPPDLVSTSTSVQREMDRPAAAAEIESSLLRQVDRWYSRLLEADGAVAIIAAWAERSSYFRGKAVRVRLTDASFSGVTDGVEPNGALRVKQANGEVTIIQAGDVERLRSNEQFD